MSRIFAAPGVRGHIVQGLQLALRAAGSPALEADGVFGPQTALAVSSFQRNCKLPATGIVDEVTCSHLGPLPSLEERCLQLTGAIEGHGYTVAVGNTDGAGLTWGIIGFTLKFGQIQQIVAAIASKSPQLVATAFGDLGPELLSVIARPPVAQRRWADSITSPTGALDPAWRNAFARFGRVPDVQQEQRRVAYENYFLPARRTAREIGLRTELGAALCFDIHVQNGGINRRARALLADTIRNCCSRGEMDLRCAIANAVADAARPRFRDDVRRRKLTIANGHGTVHGLQIVLENWGLAEVDTPELAPMAIPAHA
jgi:peptidoglycan hydrolase-like protein with peptidoglycan-binding domain